MKSFFLLAFATTMTLLVQDTLARGESLIGLQYSGHSEWEYVKYETCIPIHKADNSELKLIKYPGRTVCQHYEDQSCQQAKFPPNIHNAGYNVPVRNYGYGKCHQL